MGSNGAACCPVWVPTDLSLRYGRYLWALLSSFPPPMMKCPGLVYLEIDILLTKWEPHGSHSGMQISEILVEYPLQFLSILCTPFSLLWHHCALQLSGILVEYSIQALPRLCAPQSLLRGHLTSHLNGCLEGHFRSQSSATSPFNSSVSRLRSDFSVTRDILLLSLVSSKPFLLSFNNIYSPATTSAMSSFIDLVNFLLYFQVVHLLLFLGATNLMISFM